MVQGGNVTGAIARRHVHCLGPRQLGECGDMFCEHCEPLHEHPRKRVIGHIDTVAHRLDPERQAAGSRA
eukprot:5810318-Alexandrium_andersonii.AAC.1